MFVDDLWTHIPWTRRTKMMRTMWRIQRPRSLWSIADVSSQKGGEGSDSVGPGGSQWVAVGPRSPRAWALTQICWKLFCSDPFRMRVETDGRCCATELPIFLCLWSAKETIASSSVTSRRRGSSSTVGRSSVFSCFPQRQVNGRFAFLVSGYSLPLNAKNMEWLWLASWLRQRRDP